MAITPINGRSGRCQFNAVNLNLGEFSAIFSTVTGEITGFEDQQGDGRTPVNRTDGNDDFKATVQGKIDTGSMPSVTFKQGTILTNVKLFLDKNVAPRWCGSSRCIVRQITYHTKEEDPAQGFTIEIENAGGVITHPT